MGRARRKTEEALVVVFDSTASALAFADAAGGIQLPGRLIPVPRTLSAGCGISWRGVPESQSDVENLIAAEGIDDARLVVMQLPCRG